MGDARVRDTERGAVLVLLTLLMTGLMAVSAIVVDLGHMRAMRRSNQSVADLAALAAGEALAADAGPDAREACAATERYLRVNAPTFADIDLECSQLPEACDASTGPVPVTTGGAEYSVTVTYPVPDARISDPDVAAGGGLRLNDGRQCDRMSVAVRQTSSTFFGGIIGWEELRSSASAVVRQVPARERRVPSLWLLDPYECDALSVQGGSQVTVGAPGVGGLISLDSDGSQCTGSSTTIDVGGSGTRLQAVPTSTDPPGQITLFAMERNQLTCSDGNPRACDPSDVANGSLSPEPIGRSTRSTRAPVDHRYNCRTGDGAYPDYHGIEIVPCTADSADYLDQLRAGVGASGVPTGFHRWSSSFGCSNPAVPAGGVDGNWVVDCSTFQIGNGTDVVFNGGNVVFDGDIKMTGGSLALNASNPAATLPPACRDQITGCLGQSSAEAAWVYMRDGDLAMSGGALLADRTTIYQDAGYFSMSGGSPPRWSAPTEGPFAGLAVWSEFPSSRFQINGGASMELEGIFFTPEARPFSLSGGSPLLPQKAQFISRQAAISGGAVLTLEPLDTQAVPLPAPPALLIR